MAKRPIWPLDAPGMVPPSPDFLEAAKALGGFYEMEDKSKGKRKLTFYSSEVLEVIRRSLYGGGQFTLNMSIKENKRKPMIVVAGHRWGANPDGVATGPEPCDVMVIGKMLGDREVNTCRCMIGPTGQHFLKTLKKLGFKGLKDWYVTNILKTENPDANSKTLKAGWLTTFDHLLQQEIRLVKPRFILCLGADAVKAVMGKKMTVGKMNGRVEELVVDMRRSATEPEGSANHTIQVMACEHPATVVREPAKQDKFERDLSRFRKLLRGVRWDKKEEGLDHRYITNEKQLRALLKEADANNPSKLVAVDAEWHGQHPNNYGSYIRCIQISWAHKKAACIQLRKSGGKEAEFQIYQRDKSGRLKIGKNGKPKLMRPEDPINPVEVQNVVFELLGKFFKDKRVCGHFFNADLEWLVYKPKRRKRGDVWIEDPNWHPRYVNLDLRKQFAAPDHYEKCKTEGGWDTGLMAHALVEDGLFNLTDQALLYTDAPRYDVELDKWKARHCNKLKIKVGQLDGYGECPGEILYPYGNYDADVTRRIAVRHAKALDKDAYGNNCWEAFWVSQRAVLPVFEINTEGLPVDRKLLDRLTDSYMFVEAQLQEKIEKEFGWEGLNLNSTDQIRELLFGKKYAKRDDNGKLCPQSPAGAELIACVPAITTGKRPKEWRVVMEEGSTRDYTPSTNKQALGILLQEAEQMRCWDEDLKKFVKKNKGPQIQMIRDFRFIKQVLKSVLRVPIRNDEEDDSGDPWETNEDGDYVYEAGLPSLICDDNRVRTSISQVKETGRWSSSRPPLQNLSKRREPDYKRILGESYECPLRSIFYAGNAKDKYGRPKYVLVEADYVGAELFGMAIMSGDRLMIDHARRNQLPEDHPDFYDIHSNIAVLAFGFKCEPTKRGLDSIDKLYMRIVAKSVVFGVAYGRGAKAIALAAREEGVTVSVEEAQRVIDTIFMLYPDLVPFFEECKARAATTDPENPSPLWICGPFGRFRRFPITSEREVIGELERQAMNFPIQGMIADAVSRAVDHLQTYRDQEKMGFRMLLQVHDALLFLVPCPEVPKFIDHVLPKCMSEMVPIYPCDLDGTPNGTGPYHLSTDNEISHHWGVHMYPNECWERDIPERYAGWHAASDFEGGWDCNYFGKDVWLEKTERLHRVVKNKAKQRMFKDDAIQLAIRMGCIKQAEDLKGLAKQAKLKDKSMDEDKVLVSLISNDQGEFVAA